METAFGRYYIFQETVFDVAHENEADRMKINKHFNSGFTEVLKRHYFSHLRIKDRNRENPVNRSLPTPVMIFGSFK